MSRRRIYQNKIQKLNNEFGISTIALELSDEHFDNCKTKDNINENILKYINKNNDLYKNLSQQKLLIYQSKLSKIKWHMHLQRNHADKKLIQRIINKFGRNIQIIIGDWSEGNSLKNFISTPNKRILELLQKTFPTFLIDEFNTSKLYYDNQQILINAKAQFKHSQKPKKIHSVLYTTRLTRNNKERIAFINRDNNACHNMRMLFHYYIEKGIRHPDYTRKNIISNNSISIQLENANNQDHHFVKDSEAIQERIILDNLPLRAQIK